MPWIIRESNKEESEIFSHKSNLSYWKSNNVRVNQIATIKQKIKMMVNVFKCI